MSKNKKKAENAVKHKKTPLRVVLIRVLAIFLAFMMIAVFGYYLVANGQAVLPPEILL